MNQLSAFYARNFTKIFCRLVRLPLLWTATIQLYNLNNTIWEIKYFHISKNPDVRLTICYIV